MKSKLMAAGICVMLMSGGYAPADEGQENGADGNQASVSMEEKTSKAVEVGNKICPVSGEKVPVPGEKGAMGEAVTYEYNGKIYNLCCPMCVKDFKKDPEKYSKIADEEVKNADDDDMEMGENNEDDDSMGETHEEHQHQE